MAGFTNCSEPSNEFAIALNSSITAISSAYSHAAEKSSDLQSTQTAYLRKTAKDRLKRKRLQSRLKRKRLQTQKMLAN